MLVFGASVAMAQPVQFSMSTSTGNDTLYVGIPGSIIWSADSKGINVSAWTMPFGFTFSGANIMGPITEGADPDKEFFWGPGTGIYEQRAYNEIMGQDFTSAPYDTLLWGLLDFSGDGTFSGELNRITFIPTGEGTITIDTTLLAPNNHLSVLDQAGDEQLIYDSQDGAWPGPYVVTVITKPNVKPNVVDCGSDVSPNPAVFGNLVTATIVGNDSDNSPVSPLNYFIAGMSNSNGTGPNNAPAIVENGGNGDFTWQTSAANNDDVGIWTFDIGVDDGLDTVYCSFTVEVIGQTPFIFTIDTLTTYSNSDATVCISFLKEAGLQLAGGFDLLICYDASILTFNGATVGEALLQHGWEYWTYRLESTNPGKIRIVAIADMNNSNRHPDDENPNGIITCLNFHTSNDRTVACQKAAIRFCWEDCGDNTVSSRDGYVLYVVARDPGIIDVSGEQIYCLDPDPWGYNASVVCAGCPSDKYEVEPFVGFVNGGIRILCPGEIDARGDLNLNGLAYEIADAVLYSNYLIYGGSALDPVYYEAQIAASDVNGDGSPLTVADLVYLIRVLTGDAVPVPDGMGGPKIAAVVGKLDVVSSQQGTSVTVKASSDQDLGAGLFVFKYDNTEISEVSVSGRASDMDVEYQAENGELRVLVYNIGQEKVVAGSGNILNITTTGGGSVELVSAEAASYMGGKLESNVTAKIVPTAYALYQNYPNPFNPSTSMAMDLPTAGRYSLSIYNIAGQVVKTYSGSAEAGTLTITWDGSNNAGTKVASGVYFYRFETADFSAVRKMVLMK